MIHYTFFMPINRRQFLTTLGLTTIATQIAPAIAQNPVTNLSNHPG